MRHWPHLKKYIYIYMSETLKPSFDLGLYGRFLKSVLGTRFGSLESEKSGPHHVPNIFLKKKLL